MTLEERNIIEKEMIDNGILLSDFISSSTYLAIVRIIHQKNLYALEEKKIAFNEGVEAAIVGLGFSSRSFHYPSQFEDIATWIRKSKI